MRVDNTPRFISDDGVEFKDKERCLRHEAKVSVMVVLEKIEARWDELSYAIIAENIVDNFHVTPRHPEVSAA